jgi:hypothetical protein
MDAPTHYHEGQTTTKENTTMLMLQCSRTDCSSGLVLQQLHELIQADFAKNHLKALKCFVEVDLLKCDRLLSQL